MKTLSLSCFLTLSILLSCSSSNSTEEHPLSNEKKEVLTKGKKLFMVHKNRLCNKAQRYTNPKFIKIALFARAVFFFGCNCCFFFVVNFLNYEELFYWGSVWY